MFWRLKEDTLQDYKTTKFTFVPLEAELGIKITLAAWSYCLQFSCATLRHGCILTQRGRHHRHQGPHLGQGIEQSGARHDDGGDGGDGGVGDGV